MGREKKLILAVVAAALALILILAALLSIQLQNQAPNATEAPPFFGLLNVGSVDEPTSLTVEMREAEYQDRLPLTSDIVGNLDAKVMRFLSAGDFTELDDWLGRLEGTYRDVEVESGQDLSYMSLIHNFRSDIAIIQSFSRLTNRDDAAALLMKFQTPEVLAAAVIYAPLSIKVDSIICQDSLILPAVYARDAHLTALKRVDLRPEEYIPRVEEINRRRAPEHRVIGVTRFEFVAYGVKYGMEIVAQGDYTYAPYRIFRLEEVPASNELVTVAYLKRFQGEYSEYDWFDLDSFYVVASPSDLEAVETVAAP